MTQEEILAYIAQHVGGDAGKARYGKIQKKVPNPLAGTPGHLAEDDQMTVSVETWKTPDGQVILEGYRKPDGTYEVLSQETPKAANTSASANESVSAPPTQPNIISRKPDGSLQTDPNPNFAQSQNTPAGERSAQEQVERKRNQEDPAVGYPFTDVEKATWLNNKQKESQAADEKSRAEARQARLDAEKTANDAWTRSRTEKQDAEAANKPTMIEGKPYRAVKNDKGEVTGYEEIKVQGSQAAIPTIDPAAHLSVIGSAVQAQLQKLYDDPNLTEAQKQQRAQIIVNAGDTFLREQQGLVTTQSNAMTQGITQRGQDLTEAAGRRNTAESIWNTAFKGAMDNAKYLPAGSGNTGFNAMLGNMLLAHGSVAAAGGYKNVPREQPGPALATANAQPLSTAGGTPYTINVNVGAPPTGAPASVQQAVQPPPPQPELPVAPGMNFTGGQLRAPGYTAPPEDPMDQYNSYPGFMQGMLAA